MRKLQRAFSPFLPSSVTVKEVLSCDILGVCWDGKSFCRYQALHQILGSCLAYSLLHAFQKPCRSHRLCAVFGHLYEVCALSASWETAGVCRTPGGFKSTGFFSTHMLPPHLPVSYQKCQRRLPHFLRDLVNRLGPAAGQKKTSVVWIKNT